jgi:cephalosporin hydroxylase
LTTDLPPSIDGRDWSSSVPAEVLDRIQAGTMRTEYRGVPFFKSPFDIGLYLQLLSRQRPGTVIEVGTKYGGSALWFADMLTAQGSTDARVLSVDVESLVEFDDRRIDFLRGDANALGDVLSDELLESCPRPFLVVEDSSHHYRESLAVLRFFHERLRTGDYIVVEDGVVSQLTGAPYRKYEHGPSRAIHDFLGEHGEHYEIDRALCDHYGYNATYNPNGWLRRL